MRCSGNISNAVKLKHIDYWVSVSELSLNLCVSSQSSFESPHRFSFFTNTHDVLLADEISQPVPFKRISRTLATETLLAKVEAACTSVFFGTLTSYLKTSRPQIISHYDYIELADSVLHNGIIKKKVFLPGLSLRLLSVVAAVLLHPDLRKT